jgi:hypothetical protein
MEINDFQILDMINQGVKDDEIWLNFLFQANQNGAPTMFIKVTTFGSSSYCKLFEFIHNCVMEEKRKQDELKQQEENKLQFKEKRSKISLKQVYLMRNNLTNHYKIGRSNNPEYRERTLQSQEPDVELLFSCHESIITEKELHDLFDHKRIRGEWFDLNANDVLKIRELMEL